MPSNCTKCHTNLRRSVPVRQFKGKGLGGLSGISSLPKAMQQKCARLLEDKHGIVKKKRDLSNGNTNRQVSKVYGVSTNKFYLDVTVKQDTLLDDLETTEEREAWFAEHQQIIQKRFTEAKDIFFFLLLFPVFSPICSTLKTTLNG